MKITHITIDNLVGIESVDVALPTSVAVFAGQNGVGKSSIREAVRAALLGMPERVVKKKDLAQLVHGEEKRGSVVLGLDGGQASFTAPNGKQELVHGLTQITWDKQMRALPYCLDPAAFARSTSDERRNLLFAITGASSEPKDIIAAMRARKLTDAVIKAITPMIDAGFQGMAKRVEECRRDATASWKAITGETYGHVKAEAWAAPVGVPVDEAAITKLQVLVDNLQHRIANGHTELGAAEQKLKAWLQAEEQHGADEKLAARAADLAVKLQQDQADLARWDEQVQQLEQRAGTGPRVGLVHDLARAVAWLLNASGVSVPDEHVGALEVYEAEYGELDAQADPEAATQLPEARKARDLMQRAVANDQRDIEAAKAASARLQQPVERGSQTDVDRIRDFLRAAETELAQATASLNSRLAEQQAAARATERTEKAAAAHREVQDWQAAVDALSPGGIPADVLGKCLGPLNLALAGICRMLNFPRVEIIGNDISIHAYGRPYALLSGSEHWRVDAQIALALAELSGLRLVALDQFDILDLQGRADCITGLDRLAEAGKIETALVFGTFKKLPNFASFPCVVGHWVEGGRITETTAVAEMAA
ncbi:MAG TPA: AAA family ATPase [Castellaniella sp.]|uniref:AAA family ATPase n=1 Tax=Castellaniella sp. TaxID=1955812 RepID=UPI002EE8460B